MENHTSASMYIPSSKVLARLQRHASAGSLPPPSSSPTTSQTPTYSQPPTRPSMKSIDNNSNNNNASNSNDADRLHQPRTSASVVEEAATAVSSVPSGSSSTSYKPTASAAPALPSSAAQNPSSISPPPFVQPCGRATPDTTSTAPSAGIHDVHAALPYYPSSSSSSTRSPQPRQASTRSPATHTTLLPTTPLPSMQLPPPVQLPVLPLKAATASVTTCFLPLETQAQEATSTPPVVNNSMSVLNNVTLTNSSEVTKESLRGAAAATGFAKEDTSADGTAVSATPNSTTPAPQLSVPGPQHVLASATSATASTWLMPQDDFAYVFSSLTWNIDLLRLLLPHAPCPLHLPPVEAPSPQTAGLEEEKEEEEERKGKRQITNADVSCEESQPFAAASSTVHLYNLSLEVEVLKADDDEDGTAAADVTPHNDRTGDEEGGLMEAAAALHAVEVMPATKTHCEAEEKNVEKEKKDNGAEEDEVVLTTPKSSTSPLLVSNTKAKRSKEAPGSCNALPSKAEEHTTNATCALMTNEEEGEKSDAPMCSSKASMLAATATGHKSQKRVVNEPLTREEAEIETAKEKPAVGSRGPASAVTTPNLTWSQYLFRGPATTTQAHGGHSSNTNNNNNNNIGHHHHTAAPADGAGAVVHRGEMPVQGGLQGAGAASSETRSQISSPSPLQQQQQQQQQSLTPSALPRSQSDGALLRPSSMPPAAVATRSNMTSTTNANNSNHSNSNNTNSANALTGANSIFHAHYLPSLEEFQRDLEAQRQQQQLHQQQQQQQQQQQPMLSATRLEQHLLQQQQQQRQHRRRAATNKTFFYSPTPSVVSLATTSATANALMDDDANEESASTSRAHTTQKNSVSNLTLSATSARRLSYAAVVAAVHPNSTTTATTAALLKRPATPSSRSSPTPSCSTTLSVHQAARRSQPSPYPPHHHPSHRTSNLTSLQLRRRLSSTSSLDNLCAFDDHGTGVTDSGAGGMPTYILTTDLSSSSGHHQHAYQTSQNPAASLSASLCSRLSLQQQQQQQQQQQPSAMMMRAADRLRASIVTSVRGAPASASLQQKEKASLSTAHHLTRNALRQNANLHTSGNSSSSKKMAVRKSVSSHASRRKKSFRANEEAEEEEEEDARGRRSNASHRSTDCTSDSGSSGGSSGSDSGDEEEVGDGGLWLRSRRSNTSSVFPSSPSSPVASISSLSFNKMWSSAVSGRATPRSSNTNNNNSNNNSSGGALAAGNGSSYFSAGSNNCGGGSRRKKKNLRRRKAASTRRHSTLRVYVPSITEGPKAASLYTAPTAEAQEWLLQLQHRASMLAKPGLGGHASSGNNNASTTTSAVRASHLTPALMYSHPLSESDSGVLSAAGLQGRFSPSPPTLPRSAGAAAIPGAAASKASTPLLEFVQGGGSGGSSYNEQHAIHASLLHASTSSSHAGHAPMADGATARSATTEAANASFHSSPLLLAGAHGASGHVASASHAHAPQRPRVHHGHTTHSSYLAVARASLTSLSSSATSLPCPASPQQHHQQHTPVGSLPLATANGKYKSNNNNNYDQPTRKSDASAKTSPVVCPMPHSLHDAAAVPSAVTRGTLLTNVSPRPLTRTHDGAGGECCDRTSLSEEAMTELSNEDFSLASGPAAARTAATTTTNTTTTTATVSAAMAAAAEGSTTSGVLSSGSEAPPTPVELPTWVRERSLSALYYQPWGLEILARYEQQQQLRQQQQQHAHQNLLDQKTKQRRVVGVEQRVLSPPAAPPSPGMFLSPLQHVNENTATPSSRSGVASSPCSTNLSALTSPALTPQQSATSRHQSFTGHDHLSCSNNNNNVDKNQHESSRSDGDSRGNGQKEVTSSVVTSANPDTRAAACSAGFAGRRPPVLSRASLGPTTTLTATTTISTGAVSAAAGGGGSPAMTLSRSSLTSTTSANPLATPRNATETVTGATTSTTTQIPHVSWADAVRLPPSGANNHNNTNTISTYTGGAAAPSASRITATKTMTNSSTTTTTATNASLFAAPMKPAGPPTRGPMPPEWPPELSAAEERDAREEAFYFFGANTMPPAHHTTSLSLQQQLLAGQRRENAQSSARGDITNGQPTVELPAGGEVDQRQQQPSRALHTNTSSGEWWPSEMAHLPTLYLSRQKRSRRRLRPSQDDATGRSSTARKGAATSAAAELRSSKQASARAAAEAEAEAAAAVAASVRGTMAPATTTDGGVGDASAVTRAEGNAGKAVEKSAALHSSTAAANSKEDLFLFGDTYRRKKAAQLYYPPPPATSTIFSSSLVLSQQQQRSVSARPENTQVSVKSSHPYTVTPVVVSRSRNADVTGEGAVGTLPECAEVTDTALLRDLHVDVMPEEEVVDDADAPTTIAEAATRLCFLSSPASCDALLSQQAEECQDEHLQHKHHHQQPYEAAAVKPVEKEENSEDEEVCQQSCQQQTVLKHTPEAARTESREASMAAAAAATKTATTCDENLSFGAGAAETRRAEESAGTTTASAAAARVARTKSNVSLPPAPTPEVDINFFLQKFLRAVLIVVITQVRLQQQQQQQRRRAQLAAQQRQHSMTCPVSAYLLDVFPACLSPALPYMPDPLHQHLSPLPVFAGAGRSDGGGRSQHGAHHVLCADVQSSSGGSGLSEVERHALAFARHHMEDYKAIMTTYVMRDDKEVARRSAQSILLSRHSTTDINNNNKNHSTDEMESKVAGGKGDRSGDATAAKTETDGADSKESKGAAEREGDPLFQQSFLAACLSAARVNSVYEAAVNTGAAATATTTTKTTTSSAPVAGDFAEPTTAVDDVSALHTAQLYISGKDAAWQPLLMELLQVSRVVQCYSEGPAAAPATVSMKTNYNNNNNNNTSNMHGASAASTPQQHLLASLEKFLAQPTLPLLRVPVTGATPLSTSAAAVAAAPSSTDVKGSLSTPVALTPGQAAAAAQMTDESETFRRYLLTNYLNDATATPFASSNAQGGGGEHVSAGFSSSSSPSPALTTLQADTADAVPRAAPVAASITPLLRHSQSAPALVNAAVNVHTSPPKYPEPAPQPQQLHEGNFGGRCVASLLQPLVWYPYAYMPGSASPYAESTDPRSTRITPAQAAAASAMTLYVARLPLTGRLIWKWVIPAEDTDNFNLSVFFQSSLFHFMQGGALPMPTPVPAAPPTVVSSTSVMGGVTPSLWPQQHEQPQQFMHASCTWPPLLAAGIDARLRCDAARASWGDCCPSCVCGGDGGIAAASGSTNVNALVTPPHYSSTHSVNSYSSRGDGGVSELGTTSAARMCEEVEEKEVILVHCSAGMHRSCGILVAFLLWLLYQSRQVLAEERRLGWAATVSRTSLELTASALRDPHAQRDARQRHLEEVAAYALLHAAAAADLSSAAGQETNEESAGDGHEKAIQQSLFSASPSSCGTESTGGGQMAGTDNETTSTSMLAEGDTAVTSVLLRRCIQHVQQRRTIAVPIRTVQCLLQSFANELQLN